MALTVVKRPKGYIVRLDRETVSYTNGSSILTHSALHGLSTGDIIYIYENQAIGFWYVTSLGASTFNIREYSGATVKTFLGTGSLQYSIANGGSIQWSSEHGWNAVHLPIVYKLTSDLWPTNSVDTVRTVSSYANDNGYVKLTLSGAITSTVTELEFVKVTFTGGESSVYQILTWYSTSIVTINLPYIGGITFVSVQYYYNNYHARIRVYAGLVSSHVFTSEKPYTLITEQKVIPDSSGVVTLNINEFLKEQIEIIKNDLLRGTLPNDIDAFCQFYIEFAEAYDYSVGGYTLLDYVGTYTSDAGNFQGYAINSQLPFKNRYSGFMSNYLNENELIVSEPFAGSLGSFSNIPSAGAGWTYSSNFGGSASVTVTTGAQAVSDMLQTTDVFTTGEVYQADIWIAVGPGNGNMVRFFLVRATGEEEIYEYFPPSVSLTNMLYLSFLFRPTSDYTDFGIKAYTLLSGGGGIIRIDSVEITRIGGAKFLTPSLYPRMSVGQFFDISFINPYGDSDLFMKRELYIDDVLTGTVYEQITDLDIGVYRFQVEQSYLGEDRIDLTLVYEDYPGFVNVSETKTIEVDEECCLNCIDLSWKNYLGEMDYWRFKSNSDYGVDIEKTTRAEKNIFPNWPNSFGEGADTIRHETSRVSSQEITIRAENLSREQVEDLFRIKTSPLVQIVNSRTDRRTVIPDVSSFVYLQESEKLFNITFKVKPTDTLPSQSL